MDFPPRTPWHPTYLPRGYRWQAAGAERVNQNCHALLGGMRVVNDHYLIGDAVNDAGMAVAELFFPVAATYPDYPFPGTARLTPQDFIMWAVGMHATVRELAADLKRVTVVDARWYDHQRYPFHWLLMDQTGTYVIEPLGDRLHVRANPLAVFTNTPALDDQFERLATYLGLPANVTPQLLRRTLAKTTRPLPTGGNAIQRFAQAAMWRWRQPPRSSADLRDFLQRVTVPHTPAHAHNYTHYQAVIDIADQQYAFHDLHAGTTSHYRLSQLMQRFPQTPHRFG